MSVLHRNVPQIMIVVGVLAALLGLFLDSLGLGRWGGIGYSQWAIITIGLLTAVNGVAVWAIRNRD
jgi:hypothetical protein